MIPNKSHPKWAPLVKGEAAIQFKAFAGNMLIGQCTRKLTNDPSREALPGCIDEAHAFFSKYENLYKDEPNACF